MLLINRYIRIQLKAVHRDNESLLFVNSLITVFIGVIGYAFGNSLSQTVSSSFIYHLIFAFTCFGMLFSDFMLKCLYKRNFVFPPLVKCIPDSSRLYLQYYLLKEVMSIWNLYLPVFFAASFFCTIYSMQGIMVAIMLIAGIFLFTLLVSNIVFNANIESNKLLYGIFFLLFLSLILILFYISLMTSWMWLLGCSLIVLIGINGFFVVSNIKRMKYWTGEDSKSRFFAFWNKMSFFSHYTSLLYISLHIRMILRSPVLRNQFFVGVIFCMFYLQSAVTKGVLLDDFMMRLMLFSLILLFFSSTFTTSFSSEGAFFDRLVISPAFPSFLKSRYVECVLCTFIVFLIMIFTLKIEVELYYELIAIFLYCTGFFLPLNFLSIFFANQKLDVSSYAKARNYQPGWKILFTLLLFIVTFSIVVLFYYLFSALAATHFMFFTGLLSGLFSLRWLTIIQKLYMKHTRYKHMENYRK